MSEIAKPQQVVVEADRLERFLARIGERHGRLSWVASPLTVTITAADATTAECRVPFPPLSVDSKAAFGGLVEHVVRPRTVGVMLVRRGGYAAGVFDGTRLTASKVGSRHVQGRTAAGGWSQQRFARRREGQTRDALGAAADVVARILLPAIGQLEAVVAGGDRSLCDRVLADPRLVALHALLTTDRLDVPDPRQSVLEATPKAFRSIHVVVTDTAPR